MFPPTARPEVPEPFLSLAYAATRPGGGVHRHTTGHHHLAGVDLAQAGDVDEL